MMRLPLAKAAHAISAVGGDVEGGASFDRAGNSGSILI